MNDLKPIYTAANGETPHPLIIAGPCSAESESQVLETARSLARLEVPIFRA